MSIRVGTCSVSDVLDARMGQKVTPTALPRQPELGHRTSLGGNLGR